MKLARTGFDELAIWVGENKSKPLAIVPKDMESTAGVAVDRIETTRIQRDALIEKLDDAHESLKETIRVSARRFVEEKGWEECPYMEADEPEGGCECPATQLLDEYSKWLFDGCSGCPLADCC